MLVMPLVPWYRPADNGYNEGLTSYYSYKGHDTMRIIKADDLVKQFPEKTLIIDGQPVLVWQTGRLYSDNGQRMAAWQDEFGTYFIDFDRGIIAEIEVELATLTSSAIMRIYDGRESANTYHFPAIHTPVMIMESDIKETNWFKGINL